MAFKILPDGKKAPIGHQFVQCHVVFDIKIEDFRSETRLVAGDHMTKAPATIMYASVLSRKTVRMALMVTTLNDPEVKLGDILNACVQTPITEMVWTTQDFEFCKDTSKTAVFVRVLYG